MLFFSPVVWRWFENDIGLSLTLVDLIENVMGHSIDRAEDANESLRWLLEDIMRLLDD